MIAAVYARYGSLPPVAGVLYGIKPAVIAIILQAFWSFSRTAIKTKLLAVIGVVAAPELNYSTVSSGTGEGTDGLPPASVCCVRKIRSRSRCEPKAANEPGANAAPAPGSESKIKKSGCAPAASAILRSSFSIPSSKTATVVRSLFSMNSAQRNASSTYPPPKTIPPIFKNERNS